MSLFAFHLETHLEHAQLGVFHFSVVPPLQPGPWDAPHTDHASGRRARQAPPGLANRRHRRVNSWNGTGHLLGFFRLLDLLLRPSDPPDTSSLEVSADPGTLCSPL